MNSTRNALYFGYGANREASMMRAIIGHEPIKVCNAGLLNFELCIQTLDDIPPKAQEIIRSSGWGPEFKSYTIRPSMGVKVEGTLWRLSLTERHRLDSWEMAGLWYKKIFVTVVGADGYKYECETQQIGTHQGITKVADGLGYHSWLQPEADFVRLANNFREANNT